MEQTTKAEGIKLSGLRLEACDRCRLSVSPIMTEESR